MKQKKYYDEIYIQVILLENPDVITASNGENMKPEGDYDDGTGWME